MSKDFKIRSVVIEEEDSKDFLYALLLHIIILFIVSAILLAGRVTIL